MARDLVCLRQGLSGPGDRPGPTTRPTRELVRCHGPASTRLPVGGCESISSRTALLLTRSGLTRLVDRIEEAGFVRRERSAEDRRGVYVAITQGGHRQTRRNMARSREQHPEALRAVSQPQRRESAPNRHQEASRSGRRVAPTRPHMVSKDLGANPVDPHSESNRLVRHCGRINRGPWLWSCITNGISRSAHHFRNRSVVHSGDRVLPCLEPTHAPQSDTLTRRRRF